VAGKNYPITLVIKATDEATGKLRKISAQIGSATQPSRKLGDSFKAMSSNLGLPKLFEGFKGVGSALGNVGSEAAKLGAAVLGMGTVAGFALFSIVKGSVEAGDKLAEMAQRTGLAVNTYASLGFAAAQADVSQEEFNGAMDQFNKRLGEAKANGGPLLEFLKKTGPGLAKQIKGAKSTEEALSLMTDAMTRIKDPQRRAALAAAAFGKSGLQMGQFLGQGSEAVQKYQKRFMELSGDQTKFAEGASVLDNAMRETQTAFDGTKNAVMGELFPAFTKLSEAVTKFLVQNREGLRAWAEKTGAAISKWVDGGGLDRVVKGLQDFAATVGVLIEKMGGLKVVAIAVAVVMSSGLIASVVNLGVALAPVIWQIGTLLLGALADVALAIGAFNFAPLLAGLSTAVVVAGPFIAAAVGIALAGKAIYDNWGALTFLFKDFWNGVVFNAISAWEKIKPIVDAIAGVFGGDSLIGKVAAKVSSLGSSASGALGGTMFNLNPAAPVSADAARGGGSFSQQPQEVLVSVRERAEGYARHGL
jgi:hypothetical protein